MAIAQGISREPRVLLVDDLTATLGLGDTEEVAMLLHSLAVKRGLGVLVGVGDARATRWSERVATLAGGALMLEPRRVRKLRRDLSERRRFSRRIGTRTFAASMLSIDPNQFSSENHP